MPSGHYLHTKEQIKNLTHHYKKGHPSYLTEESKKKIGRSLKLAYAEKRIISYFAEHKTWNKGTHIQNNNALEEWRKKGGKNPSGKECWNWVKDRSKIDKTKRNNPEYRKWVQKVKKRDSNICQFKNKNCAGYNIVHHIKSWSKYPKLRYKIDNGITLCQAHHPRTRAKEKELVSVFQKLVLKSSK